MCRVRKLGVPTPTPYLLNKEQHLVVTSRVEGVTLQQRLQQTHEVDAGVCPGGGTLVLDAGKQLWQVAGWPQCVRVKLPPTSSVFTQQSCMAAAATYIRGSKTHPLTGVCQHVVCLFCLSVRSSLCRC